jgi:hypothetical protein
MKRVLPHVIPFFFFLSFLSPDCQEEPSRRRCRREDRTCRLPVREDVRSAFRRERRDREPHHPTEHRRSQGTFSEGRPNWSEAVADIILYTHFYVIRLPSRQMSRQRNGCSSKRSNRSVLVSPALSLLFSYSRAETTTRITEIGHPVNYICQRFYLLPSCIFFFSRFCCTHIYCDLHAHAVNLPYVFCIHTLVITSSFPHPQTSIHTCFIAIFVGAIVTADYIPGGANKPDYRRSVGVR